MSYFQALLFVCLCKNFLLSEAAFALLSNDENFTIKDCKENSTLPGFGIVVTHNRPNNSDRGSVLIKTAINPTGVLFNPKCIWTYNVQGVNIVKGGVLNDGSSIKWIFSMTGLLKVSVVAQFDKGGTQATINNCTYVNVTDCYLEPRLNVSTPAGSYSITTNHTDVIMDSPGMVNFTVSTFRVDPYFLCQDLYFSWSLGDGRNASGERVDHYYNETGVYYVVLKIYKVLDERKDFLTNVTVKIEIEGRHPGSKSMDTVVDVSLVLVIFFVCFVFVICVAAYWFRRRLHRHTEVARFDFRTSELQSDFDERCALLKSTRKGCINVLSCRRQNNEYLLNFEGNDDRNLSDEL